MINVTPDTYYDVSRRDPIALQLPAGSTAEFQFNLCGLPPGEYKVSLEHNRSGINSPECFVQEVFMKSNEITVRVVPGTKEP